MKHRGQRRKVSAKCKVPRTVAVSSRPRTRFALGTLPLTIAFLCIFGGEISLSMAARHSPQASLAPKQHLRYQINLSIDFEKRTYAGVERVRWLNHGDHTTSTIFFHLYPNMRVPDYVPPPLKIETGQTISDEPRLDVSAVHLAGKDVAVPFVLEDRDTTLRINLREPVAPTAATELQIGFKGSVPEIDEDETRLVTHVLQQVSAAIRNTREMRRARDTNFLCRDVMMLSAPFPILAARSGDDWDRHLENSVGDSITADAADYEVTIEAGKSVTLFAPVEASATAPAEDRITAEFSGENLREFAIVAGRNLRAEQARIDDVTIRSIYRPDHEMLARRVLKIAGDALRVYKNRFGPLPLKTVTIVDVPLVANLGSVECSGLSAIASAFYVDFDSPAMRNMPDVIRDQRASVEDSLEWTVAHVVAHQWWGVAVGNDAAREPVLDEALSNWSASLYYRETHGEEQTAKALDEQLRGVYKLYRTFGGDDMEASRAARDYRNSFQYAAIVSSKGALMFEALRKLLNDEKFFGALRAYYDANELQVADTDDLRGAFLAESAVEQRRAVNRTFDRWLSSKRGDEDIGPPDPKLAAELGLPPKSEPRGNGTVLTPFARFGKFFWQQMTKIR